MGTSTSGVGIGLDDIHLQSKSIRKDPKRARFALIVGVGGLEALGKQGSQTEATMGPQTASFLVFVCVVHVFDFLREYLKCEMIKGCLF